MALIRMWLRLKITGWLTAVAMVLLASVALMAAPRVPASAGAPTPSEKYLLDQIVAGKVANLEEAFPDDAGRVIRGAFLEELLTGSRKDCVIHRNGVQIEGALIRDALDLRNAQIACDTRLVRCRFEAEVNFSKCIFENSLSVEESVFAGPVNAVAMKVGRGATLQRAVFRSAANFEQIEITGMLMAGGVSFEHAGGSADFNSMKAGGNVYFTNAVFAGAAHFQFSHITDNLKFDGARFTNALALASFEGVKVDASASFARVSFAGYVSFKDGHFNTLDLTDAVWPDRDYGEWLWLNGMAYQRVIAGAEKDSWSNLLQLVDRAAHRSAYSTDIYSGLVDFYRREGYPRQANQFFIAQKRREREEVLQGVQWCWSLFLDWFVGYGRSPERALFWSTSVVLLGVVVFRPHRMEPRTTNLKADHYSALWYSIDLFLPLIKLQDAELWKPRDEARFARFWSRFHTMLGWALIPIAVAAWTGMLEK